MSTYAARVLNILSVDRRARSPNCRYARCGEFIVVNKAALGIFVYYLKHCFYSLLLKFFFIKDT
jgi:hypothetical protein